MKILFLILGIYRTFSEKVDDFLQEQVQESSKSNVAGVIIGFIGALCFFIPIPLDKMYFYTTADVVRVLGLILLGGAFYLVIILQKIK